MTNDWQTSIAVVLAAHGDRGEAHASGTANTTLTKHRDTLRTSAKFASVTAGVLKGEPSLEAALDEAARSGARTIAIYPLFMADGYFVKTVMTQRIAAMGLEPSLRILPPLGLDAGIVSLIADRAHAAAQAAEWSPSSSRLLVAGHGSKFSPASAEATRSVAAAVEALGLFGTVSAAFIEEPPFVADALQGDDRPTVVAGFFSGDGLHAGEDIPSAISASGATAIYSGAIGAGPEIPALILKALAASFS